VNPSLKHSRKISPLALAIVFPFAILLFGQAADFDGRPALILKNDKVELTVLTRGAMMVNLVLRDDSEKLSPFWNAERAQRATGSAPSRPSASLGHFLCLDGFGAPSAEESAAGIPFHGEANRQQFEPLQESHNGASTLILRTRLPVVQEAITRTLTQIDGENVVYVNTEVENLVAIDHPISWAEHATTGPPFLIPGQTVIDMSAAKCRVRPEKAGSTGKLAYGKDFVWPLAPLTKGGSVNLTTIPTNETSLDLATCQIDPARTYGYVTVLRPDKHLIFGYVFRREHYPWLMSWMNYSGDARAARGTEFSSQPFDISRQEAVAMNPLFDTPTFRWLPAKSKIESRFLMFYTKVPDDFSKIDDVTLDSGKLTIVDHSGKRMTLAASKGL